MHIFIPTPPALIIEACLLPNNSFEYAEWSGRSDDKLLEYFVYNERKMSLDRLHSHMNRVRTRKTAIFDPVYDGRNGLEYFRDRMGYRLVLREAKASEWVKQNGTLRFEGKIQNVGFGNIVNKKNVSVILKSKAGSNSYTALTNLDARDWRPDECGTAGQTIPLHGVI